MGKKPYSGKITDILIRNTDVDPEALGVAEEKAIKQGERLGIIGGSLLSGVAGYLILRWALPAPGAKGASKAA